MAGEKKETNHILPSGKGTITYDFSPDRDYSKPRKQKTETVSYDKKKKRWSREERIKYCAPIFLDVLIEGDEDGPHIGHDRKISSKMINERCGMKDDKWQTASREILVDMILHIELEREIFISSTDQGYYICRPWVDEDFDTGLSFIEGRRDRYKKRAKLQYLKILEFKARNITQEDFNRTIYNRRKLNES